MDCENIERDVTRACDSDYVIKIGGLAFPASLQWALLHPFPRQCRLAGNRMSFEGIDYT